MKDMATEIFWNWFIQRWCPLWGFCNGRREEHWFSDWKKKDWVYIDWADMDKDGPLCAEQMLYAACFRVMAEISKQLGKDGKCLQTGIRKTDGCY